MERVFPDFRYFIGDVRDEGSLETAMEGVDYVFHLGAESRIQPTLERPQDACMTNFVGTCNVLQAARAHAVKRVMYSFWLRLKVLNKTGNILGIVIGVK